MARCYLIQMPRHPVLCCPRGSRNLQEGKDETGSEAAPPHLAEVVLGHVLWGLVQWKLQSARGFHAPRGLWTARP